MVFRGTATAPERSIEPTAPQLLGSIAGGWNVRFEKRPGAPEAIALTKLEPLLSLTSPAVRYFSGVATYTTRFQAPRAWLAAGRRQTIDLGDVH